MIIVKGEQHDEQWDSDLEDFDVPERVSELQNNCLILCHNLANFYGVVLRMRKPTQSCLPHCIAALS